MRKFLIRWWWTENHEQDRYTQAVVEWWEKESQEVISIELIRIEEAYQHAMLGS
jgi:hypothetical protein